MGIGMRFLDKQTGTRQEEKTLLPEGKRLKKRSSSSHSSPQHALMATGMDPQ